jgi:hypothetical protein
LDHKVGNDSVEDATLVVERLARRAGSLFASAKGSEVIDGFGNRVTKKTEDHTASFSRSFDLNIKEDLVGDLFGVTAEYKGTKQVLAKRTPQPQTQDANTRHLVPASLLARWSF